MEFNRILEQSNCSSTLAIAFDPCHISKSGKKTAQVGWYWSGVSNTSKWGLLLLQNSKYRGKTYVFFSQKKSLTFL